MRLTHNIIILIFLIPATVLAKDIRVIGREKATITAPFVKLSDVASISSDQPGNEDALIALKKIQISSTITPGTQTTISAQEVLDKLKESGVDFSTVGYSFPKVMSIKRAGRKLERSEVKAVIEKILNESSQDLAIRNFTYNKTIMVPTGELNINARQTGSQQAGQLNFAFEVKSENDEPQRFEVAVVVDEWQDVPVAARPLARGALIRAEDIRIERYNVSEMPRDAALSADNLAGYTVSQDLGVGDLFRRNALTIAPVITMGSNVSIIYKRGSLEARATGVALQSGANGDDIKIRNDSSKKIIVGKVLEPGIVGVGQ